MSNEQQTTEAATTTEGAADSQQAASLLATGASEGGQQQSAPEGQVEPGQKPESDQGTKAADAAPEKYEFSPPEGFEFDNVVIDEFSTVAKELNLPQDAAQKILDKMTPVMQARQAEHLQAARAEWAESAKADKEFGGEKLAENLGVARKALDAFTTPELRNLLEESGLGNHPEVIRMFYRAGKAISEDRFVGGGAKDASIDPAKRMFPSMN